MKKEEKFLIEICNAYLYKQNITLDESIDYSRLFSVCREHNLIAITFAVIKNSPNKGAVPAATYKLFEDGFYETIVKYDSQTGVIDDINRLFSDNGIRHIFFKGAEIREYYPVPEVRAMGDIDVLIDKENNGAAKELLTANGYELKNSNGPVNDYLKNGVLIELHTKIVSGKVGSSNAESGFEGAMSNAEYNGLRGRLNADYQLAYLITHIAHHFWFYGAGIKLILDLAVVQKRFDIDYDRVLDILDDIGLKKFGQVILTLCSKWFNVGPNYCHDISITQEFVISFGAFGNAKRNKAAVVTRKQLEDGKKPSPVMSRLRLLFPPYSKMKNIPYIKFIENRPWLLPIAWIYRLFYNLKHRRSLVADANNGLGSRQVTAQAENELEYFKEIGLL